jgi:hypothetical protein
MLAPDIVDRNSAIGSALRSQYNAKKKREL